MPCGLAQNVVGKCTFPSSSGLQRTKTSSRLIPVALSIASVLPPPPRAHTRLHTGLTLWAAAQAFKNYDESGSPRRLNCLKTLVLANMLMKSKVDPFDAQEVGAPCLARMNHAGPVLGWCLPSK